MAGGENPPQRVTLRAENDNEEISLGMHKQRSQPLPGVTAWRAAIDLSSGQPRRRYSFKLLWLDRQLWFTPQGFSRFPPARLEQFAVDVPDNGPQWVADQIFYQIFPDRFARSQSREATQDNVYYHHAAGHDIVRREWDEPLTARPVAPRLWRRFGRHQRKAAVSENVRRHGAVPESGIYRAERA